MVAMTDLLSLIGASSDVAHLFLLNIRAQPVLSDARRGQCPCIWELNTGCSPYCDASGSPPGGGTGGQIQTLGYNRRVFGFDLNRNQNETLPLKQIDFF